MQPQNREELKMELPAALKAQMGTGNPDRPYTKHEYVLSYIVRNHETTVDEMLIYLWAISGEVTGRGYLHTVLKRLRDTNLIESTQYALGKSSTYRATEHGRKAARPFMEVKPRG